MSEKSGLILSSIAAGFIADRVKAETSGSICAFDLPGKYMVLVRARLARKRGRRRRRGGQWMPDRRFGDRQHPS